MGRQQIAVRDEVIRLGQFLKLAGVVETGGEAKARIQEGEAKVNGEVETRRGRQLVPGDLVEFAGEILEGVVQASDQA
jgi:ribosome-associated protein